MSDETKDAQVKYSEEFQGTIGYAGLDNVESGTIKKGELIIA